MRLRTSQPSGAVSAGGRRDARDLVGPDWTRLTEVTGKDEVFARDLVAREGWAALAGQLGDEEAYTVARSAALMWVRPDAFAAGTARRVLAATAEAGFRPLAVMPVRVDRCAVRILWAYMCRWATAERLMLLDALVALGPGLLVLWADGTGTPASVRMTAVKGRNDPRRRTEGTRTLREVAGAPNRALTMVHTADEPADVVRELAALCAWHDWPEFVAEAATRLRGGDRADLEKALCAVETELPALGLPPLDTDPAAPSVHELYSGPAGKRWAALVAASQTWPLLRRTPGPAAWPEQEERTPWQ
ncbi:hypothetical protein [Streptomyces misionensis]|uniref:hypothetical protein n=1 Tax=Streptomyces misionensis TaxID=67331 RepID=UPI0033B6293F